jgi:TonB family protein
MRSSLIAIALVLLSGMGAGQELPRSGVTPPRVKSAVKAVYTPEARAAGIEGVVWVEVIVLPDGTVGDDVKVARSLDKKFGLDEQAVNASKQWTFSPATKDGKPVAALATIEQHFKLPSK